MTRKVDLGKITVTGDLGERIDKSIANMLTFGSRPKLKFWRHTGEYIWGADFLGRWLEVMSILSEYTGDETYELDKVFERLLEGQRRNGSFHPKNNIYSIYGNKSGLRGLVAYYRHTGQQRALEAARKTADWYCRRYLGKKPSASRNRSVYFTSPLDALVELYEITGEPSYLALAEWFAELAEWETEKPGTSHHSATVFSKIKALVNLYEIVDKPEYLDTATRLWETTAQNVLWLTGGTPETFANSDVDEVCGSADWIRLCLALWRIDHDLKYLDMAERTLLNHVYFTQLPSGGCSGTCNIDQGFRHTEAWFCCSMNVPLAFSMLLKYIYACTRRTVWVNFFMDSKVEVDLDSRTRVRLEQRTKYPETGLVRLTVSPYRRERFKLKVRIPAWTDLSGVKINGQPVGAKIQGGYAMLDRTWQIGDSVDLEMRFRLRVETSLIGKHPTRSGMVRIGHETVRAKRAAVFHGPLALVVFRIGHGNDLSWVYRGGFNEVLDSGGCYSKYDGSASDYIDTDRAAFASEQAPHLTEITLDHNAESASTRWCHDLKGIGTIRYELKVLPGLPVTLEYRQWVLVKASADRPVKLKRMLLSGVRFATRKTQRRSFYRDEPSYLYPPAKVKVNGRLFVPKNGQTLRKTGTYELDNGVFQASCSYQGAVKEVRVVKNMNSTGVYLSPIPRGGLEIREDKEFEVFRRIAFPATSDERRTGLSEKGARGVTIQFQGKQDTS